MVPKRLITAATLLGFGLHLASCGSFVADHWPHWAGGLPVDAPPRPGTPGYAEFISHGQPIADKSDAKQDPAAAVAIQGGIPQASAAPAPAALPAPPAGSAAPVRPAAPDSATGQDSSVVNGGLY